MGFNLKHSIIDIGIVCSDFDNSLHFYRDQLGLEVALDIEIPASTAVGAHLAPRKFRQVRLRAGQTLIKLMEIESPPPERSLDFQAGVRWLTFICYDVPAEVARLKTNGVEFLAEPVSAPDAKHVVCAKGPDGMLIELVQLPE
jgi:glyoxylase I family protein